MITTSKTNRQLTLALAMLGAVGLLALFTLTVTASPPASAPAQAAPVAAATVNLSHQAKRQQAAVAVTGSTPISLPCPCWRVGISADGLYRLSYATLEGAGVPVSGIDPADVHLLWRGQAVALQETGDGDGVFEPGEAFLFYGQKFHGSTQDEKYTDENAYWLYLDDATAGLRMAERSVAPSGGGQTLAWYTATAHVEQNNTYWARWSTMPGSDATWFWDKLEARNTVVTYTYPITLSAVSADSYSATLRVEMAGKSDNDHRLRFSLNGVNLGESTWYGDVGYTATVSVPGALIKNGANVLDIALLAESSTQTIYLNWIEIDYRRQPVAEDDVLAMASPLSGTTQMVLVNFSTPAVGLYDVTQPPTPVRLTDAFSFTSGITYSLALIDDAPAGSAYLAVGTNAISEASALNQHAPANLITPTSGADEIIIAPSQFFTALQPLVERRRSQGLRVHLVDIDDVYALFNGGVVHPEAIRSFVAHAYANWPGDAPAYLLLVGDGNFNPKGYNPDVYGAFVPTLIPPYLDFIDPTQGEVPVDAYYGDVDWDGLPEVSMGRIPANTVAQVEGMVNKILAYEDAPQAAWMERVVMIADDYDPNAGDFKATAEDLRQGYVPPQMDTRTIYLDDVGVPTATRQITQTWNEGAALMTYVGHAAVWRWAHEPMLVNTQTQGLTNSTGLPFLISLDCYDGSWFYPPKYHSAVGRDRRSTSEWVTTVLTDRGAIAAFGPAGLGFVGTEKMMAEAMYQAMFDDHVYRLGDLTQIGRQAVSWSYMARIYTLLGDPALSLPWWHHLDASSTVLTMTMGSTSITIPSSIVVSGTNIFSEEVIVTPTWTVDVGTLSAGTYTAPPYPTTAYLTAHMGPISKTIAINIVPQTRVYLPLVVRDF